MPCAKHRAHSAFAQFFEDLVLAELLGRHSRFAIRSPRVVRRESRLFHQSQNAPQCDFALELHIGPRRDQFSEKIVAFTIQPGSGLLALGARIEMFVDVTRKLDLEFSQQIIAKLICVRMIHVGRPARKAPAVLALKNAYLE